MTSNNDTELVTVPSRDGKPQEVSLQVFQDVYAHLTGRSEKLSKRYEVPYQICYEHIRDLSIKLNQVLEQYHVHQHNASFKVVHTDGTSHTHGDYTHFDALRSQYTCPIEQLEIEYNFLIVLPKVQDPQPYSVKVNLVSAIGVNERFQKEFAHGPRVFRLLWGPPVRVEVKYIDYAVARSVLSVMDEWTKGLPSDAVGPRIRVLQQWSARIANAICYLLTGVGMYLIWNGVRGVDEAVTAGQVAGTVVLALSIVWFINRAGFHIGRMAENSIDGWQLLSYIKLTSGDDRQIEKAGKRNKAAFGRGALSLVLAVAASILANYITLIVFSSSVPS